jgi:hypothetical protein
LHFRSLGMTQSIREHRAIRFGKCLEGQSWTENGNTVVRLPSIQDLNSTQTDPRSGISRSVEHLAGLKKRFGTAMRARSHASLGSRKNSKRVTLGFFDQHGFNHGMREGLMALRTSNNPARHRKTLGPFVLFSLSLESPSVVYRTIG